MNESTKLERAIRALELASHATHAIALALGSYAKAAQPRPRQARGRRLRAKVPYASPSR